MNITKTALKSIIRQELAAFFEEIENEKDFGLLVDEEDRDKAEKYCFDRGFYGWNKLLKHANSVALASKGSLLKGKS